MKIYQDKLTCLICEKSFQHLGSHIAKAHKMTAREYKEEFGLDYNLPLISKAIYEKKRAAFEEDREHYLDNFRKTGKKYQFKKGKVSRHRFSQQSMDRIAEQANDINKNSRGLCPVCRMNFDHVQSHLYNKHRLVEV